MSDLSGFRKDAAPVRYGRAAAVASGPPVRRGPLDRSARPPGWDADVWHLTLFFEQRAQADRIELRAGRHLVYAEIDDLVKRYGLRGKSVRQEIEGCRHRTDSSRLASHCWLHWPPMQPAEQAAGVLTWVELVDVVIAEFWSRRWDTHALDHFRQHFAEYGQLAVKHWWNLTVAKNARANPAPPLPMRRRITGATMQDASKEG